ncbi:MAG TPA: MFS transporter [Pseudonocardiaceae bacterium]
MSSGPLWRNRDFMLLWSGQVVSTVGIRVSSLAYPLLVLALTGSPATAGLVGFAQTLPFLLCYLPAGALVDRWDRKRVMLTADAGRALAVGGVAVALATATLALWMIVAAVFVEGVLFVFFQLAETAALPHVVPPEQLAPALAQNQAREQGADLVGQPLGGALFGISRVLPFAFDAVSYLVSFGTLLLVRPAFQASRTQSALSAGRLRAEIAEGLRWLWGQRFLRALVALIGLTNWVFNALFLVVIVRAQQLGASPAAIGLLFAGYGAAAVAGALAAPALQRRLAPRLVILGSLWTWAAVVALQAAAAAPWQLGVVVALSAPLGPLFNVVVGRYRYALTPDRLLARATSVSRLVAWGTIPVGTLSGGVLAQAVGTVPTVLVLAAAMALIAAAATAMPTVRTPPVLA